MKKETKVLLLLLSIITVFSIVVFISQHFIKEDSENTQKWRNENISNIEFKGKVIDTKIIERGGRKYGIVCIKLDYTNIKNFYMFNDMSCLRIKNNKAIMSIGFVSESDKKINYVEININGDGKERYYKEGGGFDESDLTLASNNLIETDMKFCNE